MKTNINEFLEETSIEELKMVKEALINVYNDNANNDKQWINNFLLNFDNFFYKDAVVAGLSYATLTSNPSQFMFLLAIIFTLPPSVRTMGLIDTLSDMFKNKNNLKDVKKLDLNNITSYRIDDSDYEHLKEEIDEIKGNQKKKSL